MNMDRFDFSQIFIAAQQNPRGQYCESASTISKFFEEAEQAKASTPLSNSDVNNGLLNEIPDEESYVVFDQLWSSSDQQAVLMSQWNCLIEKTKREASNIFTLPSTNVTGIFYLCRILNTNFVIRFRALELYERYLKMFTYKMTDYLKTCSRSEFEDFMSRFESQILLRMSSCILIASKLHADTQIRSLTTDSIRRLLKNLNLTYSCQNISRSELRVLETLDFRCHWTTPLELVEQLLSILNLEIDALKRAHYFAILLLEYCYLDLDNIRLKFFSRVKKSRRHTVSNGDISAPLQCAAVVSAALFIVSTEVKSNLHTVVAKKASMPEEDVNILAIIILDLLMGPS